MFRCARIQGLDTSEGLLLFGREHYYVVDGFTLLKTREIRDLDFLPQECVSKSFHHLITFINIFPKFCLSSACYFEDIFLIYLIALSNRVFDHLLM